MVVKLALIDEHVGEHKGEHVGEQGKEPVAKIRPNCTAKCSACGK